MTDRNAIFGNCLTRLMTLPSGIIRDINQLSKGNFPLAILQRTTVDVGKVKIQGVATCLYLCMDMCGGIYASN
uniref:Uncharacterized protein n=1 Tax=Phlebotomus papatasi TaxID=29031 RepID=A0A1B0D2A0_PHLPP